MPRRKPPPVPTLPKLVFGEQEEADAKFRVLVLVDGALHDYTREHGLRRCPAEWASRALVVAGINPSLILGHRKEPAA